jgi:hypothetical protein
LAYAAGEGHIGHASLSGRPRQGRCLGLARPFGRSAYQRQRVPPLICRLSLAFSGAARLVTAEPARACCPPIECGSAPILAPQVPGMRSRVSSQLRGSEVAVFDQKRLFRASFSQKREVCAVFTVASSTSRRGMWAMQGCIVDFPPRDGGTARVHCGLFLPGNRLPGAGCGLPSAGCGLSGPGDGLPLRGGRCPLRAGRVPSREVGFSCPDAHFLSPESHFSSRAVDISRRDARWAGA